ncbi:FAD/NAD(P)-binding domain-containing protein [Lophium mytilinum]|uniref:FAD/NAD(P)-binding domain-containing protein n=1 Tax=Lophium mytilinum TaxID=390894 RepID=A0A6A6R4K4_9PEZI|nr:FAD/NAD(P)-binding domain-containing protein [Lophium mytilinum]
MGSLMIDRRVAIIGAGTSGLAAAKSLIAEDYFCTIDVFEQRGSIGGLWNYTAAANEENHETNIPEDYAHVDIPQSFTLKNVISPIYEDLEANIPRTLMRYSDFPFPDDLQLLPQHHQILSYIQAYGQEVLDRVRMSMLVVQIKPEIEGWEIKSCSLATGTTTRERYGAVIIATGQYSVPWTPDLPGLREWTVSHPGTIIHSKCFRTAENFIKRRVIVVGSGVSGLDISSRILPLCNKLYLSSRRSPQLLEDFPVDLLANLRPPIARLCPDRRAVQFEDDTEATDVDCIIFCTGYLHSMPFLRKLEPNPIESGHKVNHTYQHLFYAPKPTLAFLALPRIIAFTVAEAQAAVVARVYAKRLQLPSIHEMQAWETPTSERTSERDPDARRFHHFQYPEDAEYIKMLIDWASRAEIRPGLDNNGKGRLPRPWGPHEHWQRARSFAIRRAFKEQGKDRVNVKTLEDLGFEGPITK